MTSARISGSHSVLPVRPLHRSERELLACFGKAVDLDRVRIYTLRSWLGRWVLALSGGVAVTLGYRIFLPARHDLPMLAHEMTHVCQYQRWGRWRYYARGAWNQVVLRLMFRRDVYGWLPESGKTFDEFGMEQQSQIVQDCFNVASPKRLQAKLISPFVPM